MKIVQLYHSSTGNNRLCASVFEQEVSKSGHACATTDIRNVGDGRKVVERIGECDLFGVTIPTYYFKAPINVIEFLDSLPVFEPKPFFVLNCCTSISSNTIAMLAGRLQEKNLYLIDRLIVHGEESYPPFRFKFFLPQKGKPGKRELERVRGFARGLCEKAEKITADSNHTFRRKRYPIWPTPFHLIAISASCRNMMRYMFGKRLVPDACTSCGTCARECPTGSIELFPHDLSAMERRRDVVIRRRGNLCARLAESPDGTVRLPVFADTCMGCYACVNLCPARAIHTPVAAGRPPFRGPDGANASG